MQGFLSDLFGGGGAADEDQQQVAGTDDAGAEQDASVQTETHVTYEDADGTTHSYSSEQDLTADADLDADLGATANPAEGTEGL